MDYVDAIGFLACSLVLATFCMASMKTLRFVAFLSNIVFIPYGRAEDLTPLLLHGVLLPINAWWVFRPDKMAMMLEKGRFIK